jgi:holo-[acyl-carrier protein] synthase
MSLRTGIDLVSVDTIREALAAHGERYLARVYTERELADCRTESGVDTERLAGRFAAKEAAFKALRMGDRAIAWTDVETVSDATGWTKLSLSGSAADIAASTGITDLSLSITHEGGFAAAVVIAEIASAADSDLMTPTSPTP